MLNILLILLGCNIPYLLNSRINEAVNFAKKMNDTNVYWFLSGGIKNPLEDTVSEAHKMAEHLSKYEGNNWTYIYDTVSTNTAENFIMTNNFINEAIIDYTEVYIVTSNFHFERANKIAERIFNKHKFKQFKWVLADAELADSLYWEKIHIKNVDNDVNKAINKFHG